MPRYDYRCSACGHVYEKREGFDAPSLQECPQCNGQARRLLTPPAIVFKGSGWYSTDSRKGSAGSDGDTVSTTNPAPKTETTTETKNDAPKSEPTATAAAD